MNDSNSSFIKSCTERDVFLEAQMLLEKLGDIICTCPTCMDKLRASKVNTS
jgi:hypothetical protein